ncbi:hypothetical protein C2S51_024459 [Perilla frutescens var. frutescens]|nr:hypothetical protein C2S51_024459 [Perilla frutescens var. frutescens]
MATGLVIGIAIFSSLIQTKLVCNGQAYDDKCIPSDRRALLDFKKGLNDPSNALSSWRGMDCCRWRGVSCDNVTGAVVIIHLHSNFSGEIRPSLLHMESLKLLDLSSNAFGGISIPKFIASMKNLQYLNLSNAGFSGTIDPALGNLSSLQVLDVSNSGFQGLVADRGFEWITGLVSLKVLDMNGVDLSLVSSSNWLEMLNMLPHLTELHLSACGLSGSISYLSRVNLTSLSVIDLSLNSFSSAFPDWLVNISSLVYVDLSSSMLRGRIPLGFGALPNLRILKLDLNGNLSASARSMLKEGWQSIEFLSLASNRLHGKLPASIGNMTSLTNLNMFDNYVEGGIPSSIGSLCRLVSFDVSGNNMTGSLPEFLEGSKSCGDDGPLPYLETLRLSNNQLVGRLPDWLGKVKNLKEVSFAYNLFEGSLPASLGSLRNLTDLSLAGNRLNGTLPQSVGQLSELVVLDLSHNYFTGYLSEVHFIELRKMKILSLDSNSFVLNVSSNWLLPFQIRNLNMGSCQLGHSFPSWLRSQNEIMFLDISNASISGSIPGWFWDLSFNLSLLNVSFNRLQGQLPSFFQVTPYADIDLSSNMFEGSIPLPSVPIELLDLSNNRFQGLIPQNISDVMPDLIFLSLSGNQLIGEIPDSIGSMSSISVIDLSRNNLNGSIPSSIGKCSYLRVLDLGNNNLSGEIPNSIGQLKLLQTLHINNNFISGKLPSSFKNLSNLETLDLGNNALEGSLPPWLGEDFTKLRIINLRSNKFSGEILTDLSNLSSLQVLDLAENILTGRIPTSLGNLKAMAQEEMTNKYLLYGKYRGVYYEENLVVNTKNELYKYTKTLSLVTAIDLSGNSLSGDIPVELTNLTSLMILNLSRNHITGQIPASISRLRQLASLDLSSNQLSGAIPPTMGSLSFLGYLNLSNNNLSGKIPVGDQMLTFDARAYEGNPGLCGDPLAVKCHGEDSGNGGDAQNGNDEFIDEWFYLSIGLGFAVGIVVPCLVLVIKKPWSDKYFDFLDVLIGKFFVGRRRRPRTTHRR